MPLLKRLSAYLAVLSLLALLTLAGLVTVARLAPPLADGHRESLERVLSEHLGYRVSIGVLRLGLAGFAPRLTLERIRLARPEDGSLALGLKAMELDLDVLASLRIRSPQIKALTLVGATLSLELTPDGGVRIQGLGALRGDDHRALELFLRQGRLALTESEIRLLDPGRGGKLMRLLETRLTLDNVGRHHWLDLSARLVPPDPLALATDEERVETDQGEPAGQRLHLAARLDGPPDDPWRWSGRGYLRLTGSNPGLLLPRQLLGDWRLDTRSARLEAWVRIHEGALEQSWVRADLVGLSLSSGEASASQPSAEETALQPETAWRVRALARIRPLAPGWEVRVGEFAASVDGAELSDLDLALRLNPDWTLAGLAVASRRLDLSDLSGILGAVPWSLPEPLSGVLEQNPRGVARDLALRVDLPAGDAALGAPRWRLAARVSGLGLDRRGRVPGFAGLDLAVSGDQDGGWLRLGSEALALDLSPLFDRPLSLDQFAGRLGWQRRPEGGWSIAGRELVVENADLAGRARLDLELPGADGRPFMDLRASFHDGNGANVRPYLPAGIMDPALVTWLDGSIVAGRVTQGDLIFRGALADYPFRQRQGRFELRLAFEDLRLDYQPGWPPIESAAGHLRFLDQGLTIRVDEGRILNSAFANGRVDLPELAHVKRMRIHGEAEGPFADGTRVLAESPLAEDLGRLAELLEVGGESRLVLDIDLPFDASGRLGVAGRLTWPRPATLGVRGTNLRLSDLGGQLDFTERGIQAPAVSAKLWDQPLELSIATEGAGDPETSITRIQARARTPVQTLAERIPAQSWSFLAGRLDWDLAVTLRNRDVRQAVMPLDFRLASSLRGVAIDMPAPLGKPAVAARALDVTGHLVPGRELSLTGRLGELGAHLGFELNGSGARLTSGWLRFGASQAPAPERPGLYLDGRVDELDLPAWIDWSRGVAVTGANDAKEAVALSGLAIEASRLRLGDLSLTDAALRADPVASGWRVRLDADEATGQVMLPRQGDERRLTIDLERLDLERLLAGSETALAASSRSAGPDPLAALPSLDLRVSSLDWGDSRLGRLDLALRQDLAGTRLPSVTLTGPGLLVLRGEGDWVRDTDGGRSRVNLSAETPDLGRILAELDDKKTLEAGEARAKVQLDWPGGLSNFAWSRAAGFLDLRIGSGRFLEVEPGVGRLLGFVNVAALGRRLALDFSDLYGQGFAFEQMHGRITIARGQARFDDFLIEGPAGKVMVGGLADLTTQRVEQTVTVEPKLGSGVALASAVAGGPVVGAAVYLVDRATGNTLDRLGRYQYRVTGPWDEPEWTRLGWEPLNGRIRARASANQDEKPAPRKNHFIDLE